MIMGDAVIFVNTDGVQTCRASRSVGYTTEKHTFMAANFILSDFLSALRVPHTPEYTNAQFESMPFKSLFGLSKLLQKYGVESQGYMLLNRNEILHLTPPFLAHTPQGFVIVTEVGHDHVDYLSRGESQVMPVDEFKKIWDGNVFLAFPTPGAREPDYSLHSRMRAFESLKKVALVVLAIVIFAYLFIFNDVWTHVSTVFLAIFNLLGLVFTFMLVQKSMKIKSRAADKVCGVIEEGGCDTVLETKASTFYGLFSWSEIGFTYFSVSLLTLLIFPQYTNYLAACNICCLPFTLWSVWYQKFRAKAWCTLCLSVQATLWLLFICYLSGGWIKDIFPLKPEFFVLIASYALVLLALNRIMPLMTKSPAATADNASGKSSTGTTSTQK